MHIHVVRKGDTVWKLGQRYGISIGQIVRANGLEQPSKLVVGQSLIIPPPYLRYKVRPGDNLSRIAQSYGTNTQAILQNNQLTNAEQIYPGQRLTIPVMIHQAEPGQNLWSIANQYKTDVQTLMSANQIQSPNTVYAGQLLRIPEPPKPEIDVNAFMTQFGPAAGDTVRNHAAYLTYVSAFGYRVTREASLNPVNDTAMIAAAQANTVIPMMLITNFSSTETGTALAHTILIDQNLQNTLLTNVINTMKSKGYRGLNIDFENVDPGDKDAYNSFCQLAVNRLHPEGFFVSSSLAPKTRADQPGLLYEAHDYAAHGRIMDFVVLMTYEWGYRLGPPQAISPVNKIRQVLEYALTVIPRKKIFMGFQVYARDWLLPHKKGMQAQTFDMQEAIRRAIANEVVIEYDQTAASPYYHYTDPQGRKHVVWFEDPRSAQAKFDLVKTFKLRGISYWVLDYPFPQNWTLLGYNFQIRKLE